MRDCYQALNIDNSHLKSLFRLAKCLNDLGWYTDAHDCLKIFIDRFPKYAHIPAHENLLKSINDNIRKAKMSSNQVKKSKNINKRFKTSGQSKSKTDYLKRLNIYYLKQIKFK